MRNGGTQEDNVIKAFEEALARLRVPGSRVTTHSKNSGRSGMAPLDLSASRGVAGATGTTGGPRSITC